jgi:hypothetical protein
MGFSSASRPVVIQRKPDIKPVIKAQPKLVLVPKPAAPKVDPVAELVAKYREIETPQGHVRIGETKQVVAAIAKRYGVTFNDIIGPSRKAKIVAARYEAIVTVAQLRHLWSLPEIGRFFGGRDHTTILHCIKKMAVQTGETIKGYTPEEAAYLLDRQRDKNRDAIKTYRSKRGSVAL